MGKKDKYPAEEEDKKTCEVKSNYPSADKRYMLIFKHNRSFELHIGGRIVERFSPNGKAEVGSKIINHPDFEPVRAYFNVKEL